MSVVVKAKAGNITVNGVGYRVYAIWYANAARRLIENPSPGRFDPVPYQLYCQALELHLKSFIWLVDQLPIKKMTNKYGHELAKLWSNSKARGIGRYAKTTSLRDRVITSISPYYAERRLCYFDISMISGGYRSLREDRQIFPVLDRLCAQLAKSLRTPVLSAS